MKKLCNMCKEKNCFYVCEKLGILYNFFSDYNDSSLLGKGSWLFIFEIRYKRKIFAAKSGLNRRTSFFEKLSKEISFRWVSESKCCKKILKVFKNEKYMLSAFIYILSEIMFKFVMHMLILCYFFAYFISVVNLHQQIGIMCKSTSKNIK